MRLSLIKRFSANCTAWWPARKPWNGGISEGKAPKRAGLPTSAWARTAGTRPPPTQAGAAHLIDRFHQGVAALTTDVAAPFERATAFFLFGALQQFFFDGNKRTSRFMMNGVLMMHGIDAISVPAARAQEFNEKMIRFYVTREATEMLAFLTCCHPESGPQPGAAPGRLAP